MFAVLPLVRAVLSAWKFIYSFDCQVLNALFSVKNFIYFVLVPYWQTNNKNNRKKIGQNSTHFRINSGLFAQLICFISNCTRLFYLDNHNWITQRTNENNVYEARKCEENETHCQNVAPTLSLNYNNICQTIWWHGVSFYSQSNNIQLAHVVVADQNATMNLINSFKKEISHPCFKSRQFSIQTLTFNAFIFLVSFHFYWWNEQHTLVASQKLGRTK